MTIDRIMRGKRILFMTSAVVLMLLLLFYTKGNISIEFGIIGSMITFIYGFFVDSVFKFVEKKYNHFKIETANLLSYMQSIYNLAIYSKNKKFKKELGLALLGYIDALKSHSPQRYEDIQDRQNKLDGTLAYFKIKSKEDANVHNRLIQFFSYISRSREQLEVFGDKYITGDLKFIFYLYPVIISSMVLLLVFGYLYLSIVGILLIMVLVYTTYLVKDLDSLDYGEYRMKTRNLNDLKDYIENN